MNQEGQERRVAIRGRLLLAFKNMQHIYVVKHDTFWEMWVLNVFCEKALKTDSHFCFTHCGRHFGFIFDKCMLALKKEVTVK